MTYTTEIRLVLSNWLFSGFEFSRAIINQSGTLHGLLAELRHHWDLFGVQILEFCLFRVTMSSLNLEFYSLKLLNLC